MASNQPNQDRPLYAVLNVAHNASEEEIRAAYRRLSVLFHPDKHSSGDADGRQRAESEFMRLKHAYEVLTDAHLRSIYDLYGEQGLKADWEIIPRVPTGSEMLETYERLRRLQQEEYAHKLSKPCGTTVMRWDARPLAQLLSSLVQSEDQLEMQTQETPAGPKARVSSSYIDQSLEVPLSAHDTMTYSCHIESRAEEKGWGTVGANFRHCISSEQTSVSATVNTGVQVGHVSQVSTGCHLSFPSVCFVYGDVAWRPWSRRQFLPRAYIGRHFTPYITGRFEYQLHEESSESDEQTVRLVLERRHSYGDLCAHISAGVTTPPSVGLKYSPKLLSSLTGRLEFEFSAVGIRVGSGVDHAVTPMTRIGMKIDLSFPGGVQLTLRFRRGDQRLVFPFTVSDEVTPSAVIYATVLPLSFYYLVRECVVRPYARRCAAEEARVQSTLLETELAKKRKENEQFVQLMTETFQNSVSAEKARHGLIILNAWYGRLVSSADDTEEDIDTSGGSLVDVTVALQCLVKDSRLILYDTNKSSLPGFYDPAPKQTKCLRVRYEFHKRLHEVTVGNAEPLQLPKASHALQPTS